MAAAEHASPEVEDLRRQLADERAQLAADLASLRNGASPAETLRSRLPLIVAAGFVGGFVLAGGIGATIRLVFRRGREGQEVARFGRYVVLDRD
jgi:cellobiose-specific phosphotransferase system component IIC